MFNSVADLLSILLVHIWTRKKVMSPQYDKFIHNRIRNEFNGPLGVSMTEVVGE